MRHALALGLLVSVFLATACNGKQGPVASPFEPSAAQAPSSPPGTGTGATVTGTVSTGSGPLRSGGAAPLGGSGLTIAVVGSSVSSAVSANGEFSLQGVPPGVVRIQVTGPGVDASFTLNDVQAGQIIQIKVVLSGSTGIVEQDSRQVAGEVQIEGRVEVAPGPDSVFTVAGTRVHATEGVTSIRKGGSAGTLADIRTGVRVHVKGTPGTGLGPVVEAREVTIQNEHEDLPAQKEVEGRIDALPAPAPGQFFVGGRKVVYDGTTAIAGGTAADLVAGASVKATGTLVATATPPHLRASRIEIEHDDDAGSMEVEGTVKGAATGRCDTLRFYLQAKSGKAYEVRATATTVFRPACGTMTLAAGDRVEVKGTAAGTVITATKIEKAPGT